jgi:hypothetical protein
LKGILPISHGFQVEGTITSFKIGLFRRIEETSVCIGRKSSM